jgi:hypothetical protein
MNESTDQSDSQKALTARLRRQSIVTALVGGLLFGLSRIFLSPHARDMISVAILVLLITAIAVVLLVAARGRRMRRR